MEEVKVQVKGANELARQLQALMLSPEEKKEWLYTICRRVAKKARYHTQTQTNLDGSSYAPRKQGKKKMERKITKFSLMKIFGNALQARVAYKKHITGVVARMQQEGIPTKAGKKTLAKAKGQKKIDPTAPCTPRQAEALIDVGYMRRMKGGKLKKVSMRWIIKNMTMGQAGRIYRAMAGGKEKSEWTIPLPARSFLGATQAELKVFADAILNEILTGVKAGKAN